MPRALRDEPRKTVEGLVFDESAHIYRWRGKRVPSVTQVIAPLYDWSRVDPAALAIAGRRGTVIHRAIELALARNLDESSVSDTILSYVESVRLWVNTRLNDRWEVSATEHQFYCDLGFAGTVDLVLERYGRRLVVDFKTGEPHPAHDVQLAAYARGLQTVTGGLIPAQACLYLSDHKHANFVESAQPQEAWSTFVACLTVHNWKQRYQN